MFKKPHPLPLFAAGLMAGLALAPTQAVAAPLAITVPSAMPLAAIATTQAACLPGAVQGGTNAVRTASPTATISKSSAILGGTMSALERMRMQQAGAATAQNDTASLAGALPAATAALPVTALGFTCPTATQDDASPVLSAQPRTAGAFLGTERVKIGKTRFDRDWKRVARKGLSQRDLTAAIGAVPGEQDALFGKVNAWVNREIAYRSDKGGDNWADARSTLSKRAGDCEDYAILKMQMLAAAGVEKDDMMLTLARDTLRRIDHAVLLVKNDSDVWVMLDMQSDRIAPASADYGYKPVMSFAGNDSFLHGRKYGDPEKRSPRRLALAD